MKFVKPQDLKVGDLLYGLSRTYDLTLDKTSPQYTTLMDHVKNKTDCTIVHANHGDISGKVKVLTETDIHTIFEIVDLHGPMIGTVTKLDHVKGNKYFSRVIQVITPQGTLQNTQVSFDEILKIERSSETQS